jgi:hypothetical protein
LLLLGRIGNATGCRGLPDAAFQMNSTTIYSGGILSTITPFSVTVDDVWGEDRENTW